MVASTQSSSDVPVPAAIELHGDIGIRDTWSYSWQRLTVTFYRYLGGWGNIGEFPKLLALDFWIPTDGCGDGGYDRAGSDKNEDGMDRKNAIGNNVLVRRRT